MRIFFLALVRCVSLSLAYVLSTLSAAMFITFVLFLDSDTSWIERDPVAAGSAFVFMMAIWFTVAWIGFIPSLITSAIFEFVPIKSALSNMLAGGGVALIVGFSQNSSIHQQQEILPYPAQQVWVAILAAGFVGGFIYWLLAGHRAGRWLDRSNADPEFGR